MIGRLPESWIPPAHILDLRARVRTRHLLSHQRTEWQQRMHSVLYHHGFAQQRNLLTLEKREWLAGLALPAAAREQLTIALQRDRRARAPARPVRSGPAGVCAQAAGLPRADPGDLRGRGADRGHDPRRARRRPPLPELARRRALRRHWTSPSTNPTITARPDTSPAKDHPRCAGRYMRPRNAPASPPAPTDPITSSSPPGSAATARASRSRANSSNAATTSSKPSATRRSRPSPDPLSRGKPEINR